MRVLMLILLCLTLTACTLPGGTAVWNGSSASTGAGDLVLDARVPDKRRFCVEMVGNMQYCATAADVRAAVTEAATRGAGVPK